MKSQQHYIAMYLPHVIEKMQVKRAAELTSLLDTTKKDYESLKNSVVADNNARQSQVTLLQGKEKDSSEHNSSSSAES